MENKPKLIEDLKALETDVNNHKIEAKSIQSKLKISYDYETDLLVRLEKCRSDRNILIDDLNKVNLNISKCFRMMKGVLDVFTGNFYNL